jgi:hypothetical protein
MEDVKAEEIFVEKNLLSFSLFFFLLYRRMSELAKIMFLVIFNSLDAPGLLKF